MEPDRQTDSLFYLIVNTCLEEEPLEMRGNVDPEFVWLGMSSVV